MTNKKLFTTVFDGFMFSHGYKRKGRCYFKIDGEMLKGATIVTVGPAYSIHFHASPFWFSQTSLGLVEYRSFAKGYWAEEGYEIFPGASSYCVIGDEQRNLDFMNLCFEAFKKHIFPYIEATNDIDSYIKYALPQWESNVGIFNPHGFSFNINTSSFGSEYEYIDDRITVGWRRIDEKLQYAYLYKAYEQRDFDKPYEEFLGKINQLKYPGKMNYYNSEYVSAMRAKDYEWIERYKQERIKLMTPRLKEELGLVIGEALNKKDT